MNIKKIIITAISMLFFSLLILVQRNIHAQTCEDVLPTYTNFDIEGEQECIDEYNSCTSDPYNYSTEGCSTKCAREYPGRLENLTEKGCYDLGENYYQGILKAYTKSYSEKSATKLADWCKCLKDCRLSNKIAKDIEKECDDPLVECCNRLPKTEIDKKSGAYSDGKIYYEDTKADPNVDYDDSTDIEETPEEDLYFTIVEVKGDVYIYRNGNENNEVEAKKGMRINISDSIYTGYKSKVYLQSENGSIIIPDLSNLTVSRYSLEEGMTRVQINLRAGKLTSKLIPARGLRAKFEIKTPTSTIGVRGTIFSVEYDKETNITKAIAHEHDIYIIDNNTGQTTDISEGNYALTTQNDVEIKSISNDMKLPDQYKEFFDSSTDYQSFGTIFDQMEDSTIMIVLSLCLGVFVILSFIGVLILIVKKKIKFAIILAIVGLLLLCCSITSLLLYLGNDEAPAYPNNQKSDYDTYDDKPIDSDSYEDPIEFEDGTLYPDTIPDPELMGFFENDKYNYSVFVDSYAPDLVEKETSPEWAVTNYDYCIPLEGNDDYTCGENQLNLFTITVFSETQYNEEVVGNPLGSTYTLLDKHNRKFFVLSYPNGDVISNLNIHQSFYNEIVESFTFTE